MYDEAQKKKVPFSIYEDKSFKFTASLEDKNPHIDNTQTHTQTIIQMYKFMCRKCLSLSFNHKHPNTTTSFFLLLPLSISLSSHSWHCFSLLYIVKMNFLFICSYIVATISRYDKQINVHILTHKAIL